MRERCKKQVPDGGRSVKFHRCGNYAKPGSEFCGIHGPKETRAETRDAVAPAVVTSWSRVTWTASLTWAPSDGPIVPVPYWKDGTLGVVTRAGIQVHSDDNQGRASIKVRGLVLKKDGTPGDRRWDADTYWNKKALPERYVQELMAALDAERGKDQAND